jgi:hypothetical protein
MSIQFERIPPNRNRAVAIVGDTIGAAIGTPLTVMPAILFNVLVQPSGSDVFTGASNVAYSTAIAATFSASGYHQFSVQAGDAFSLTLIEIIVFPAAALTLNAIQYDQIISTATTRSDVDRRNILRAIALAATKSGAQSALEGGAAVAGTSYGANSTLLGISTPLRFDHFGGTNR